MKQVEKLSIGSDPEVFLVDRAGKPISSTGKLGGTKGRPRQTKNGAILEDCTTAELNPKPARSREEFIRNTQLSLEDLREILEPAELELSIVPSVVFDADQIMALEDMYAGCEPDLNAWTGEAGITAGLIEGALRSAGGHVHIQCEGDDAVHTSIVKALDLALAVPSTIVDGDQRRRKLYGMAGSHRLKRKETDPYHGVEYRTLSNFWLKTPERMGWIYDTVSEVLSNLPKWEQAVAEYGGSIQQIVNRSLKKDAEELMQELRRSYGLYTPIV